MEAMEVIRQEVDRCHLVEVGVMGVVVIRIVEVERQRGVIQGARGRGQEVEVILAVEVTHLVERIRRVVVALVVVLHQEVGVTLSRMGVNLLKAQAADLSIIRLSHQARQGTIFVPLRTSRI